MAAAQKGSCISSVMSAQWALEEVGEIDAIVVGAMMPEAYLHEGSLPRNWPTESASLTFWRCG